MRDQKPLYKLFSIISGVLLALGIVFLLMSYKEFSTFLCVLAVTVAFIPNLLNKEKIGYVCVIFGLIILVLSLFY
ncbi:hypothetical protein ACSBQ3_10990 [Staphylococcus equorum]|nr:MULTISPECIES: hypothetical protein [Staphylococcus]OEK72225.1 hypothetical protein AST02_00620 [Staphylococcus equorum]PTE27753.1 hypothetical protein BUY91_07495 [Staphylococcus equorum]PTE81914.1 hypothetical protein BUY90_12960 [Staphylococcus equorum]RIL35301.1 hypothetical protein BUY86_08900 [Staphylococcus equorum]RIO24515.1 hypothetical protein BUZ82_07085 [Staphylococcus saprophyticus]